ncbi:MAG TPA: hypothetical protein VFR23_10220 [Jiangellaceae bacterium]|nr:hypothetical protein [Jiangellaceae bacterium]
MRVGCGVPVAAFTRLVYAQLFFGPVIIVSLVIQTLIRKRMQG